MDDWVVILEYDAAHLGCFELKAVQDLVEQLREFWPSGLYSTDRYAIQMKIPADNATEALRAASYFHDRAATSGGATPSFVRAEIVTTAKYHGCGHDPATTPPSQAMVSGEIYRATRAMLTATSEADVSDALVDFVISVGGQIDRAHARQDPSAGALNLPQPGREPLGITADPNSMTRLLLERWLPPLIDDATRRIGTLTTNAATTVRANDPPTETEPQARSLPI